MSTKPVVGKKIPPGGKPGGIAICLRESRAEVHHYGAFLTTEVAVPPAAEVTRIRLGLTATGTVTVNDPRLWNRTVPSGAISWSRGLGLKASLESARTVN